MLHVCRLPGDLPSLESTSDQSSTKAHRSGRGNDFKLKYKTELCRGWEKGECAFGPQCAFAHGPWELRERSIPPTLKTKPCRSFQNRGYCLLGARCQFIHSLHSRSSPTPTPAEPGLHRLPVFVSLGGVESL